MSYRPSYPSIPSWYSGTQPQTNYACPAPACRNNPHSSAERMRTCEEEAFLSDTPRMWDIFRPDARPTTFEEGIAVMRTMTSQVNAISTHERFLAEQTRNIAALRARPRPGVRSLDHGRGCGGAAGAAGAQGAGCGDSAGVPGRVAYVL